MDSDTWLGLSILLVCLALLGFIALAEAALGLVSRERLRQMLQGRLGTWVAKRLLSNPEAFHSAAVITKSLSMVGFAATAMLMGWGYYASQPWVVAGLAVLTVVMLALFQFLPRAFAARYPEGTALALSVPAVVLTIILSPLIRLFQWATRFMLIPLGKKVTTSSANESGPVCPVPLVDREASIQEYEKKMIRGIIDLEATTAREIMVPRIDIVAVSTETSVAEAAELVLKRHYSRMPLSQDTLDNIVGIVYAKDLLGVLHSGKLEVNLKDIARPAHFIPESKRVDELLHDFRQRKVHMSIVVDEYGGTAGLVTFEDLLEEIVGEIEDEYDMEEPPMQRVSDNEAILNARVSIEDLNEMFGLSIQGEDFDTVGGFLLSQLGRIPNVGDAVTADGVTIMVLSTAGRRIKKVKVTRTAGADGAEAPPAA